MKKYKYVLAIFVIVFILFSTPVMAQEKNENLAKSKKTACLLIKESYEDKDGPIEIKMVAFKDLAESLLAYAGLVVVDPEFENCDYTLRIASSGKALGNFYSSVSFGQGMYYYTGASVSGTAKIESKNGPADNISFSANISPPEEIRVGNQRTTPQRAPFKEAFRLSQFTEKMVDMFGNFFGIEFLMNAVNNFERRNAPIRERAKSILEDMGDPAIEEMISLLKCKDETRRRSAWTTLEMLTGQYFGSDYDAWLQWWEVNKS